MIRFGKIGRQGVRSVNISVRARIFGKDHELDSKACAHIFADRSPECEL